jgi:hypothetical protein
MAVGQQISSRRYIRQVQLNVEPSVAVVDSRISLQTPPFALQLYGSNLDPGSALQCRGFQRTACRPIFVFWQGNCLKITAVTKETAGISSIFREQSFQTLPPPRVSLTCHPNSCP